MHSLFFSKKKSKMMKLDSTRSTPVGFVSDLFHSVYFLAAVSNHMFTSGGSTCAAILRILNRYSLSFSRLSGHHPSSKLCFSNIKPNIPSSPKIFSYLTKMPLALSIFDSVVTSNVKAVMALCSPGWCVWELVQSLTDLTISKKKNTNCVVT